MYRSFTIVHNVGRIPDSYSLSSIMAWFTTLNALQLSSVTKNNGAHEFIFTSALASDTRADITGNIPLIKANCSDD